MHSFLFIDKQILEILFVFIGQRCDGPIFGYLMVNFVLKLAILHINDINISSVSIVNLEQNNLICFYQS